MSDFILNVNTILNDEVYHVYFNVSTTAEDACIQVCKDLKIGTLARHLFALRDTSTNLFYMPSQTFNENNLTVELRIRFKPADSSKLLKTDKHAFDYLFYQVRKDILENKIPDIIKEKHRNDLLGLGVTDMYRVMQENKISRETIESQYKMYIPKYVLNFYERFYIRRCILQKLNTLVQKLTWEPNVVKAQYIKTLENMAPEYLSESYEAILLDQQKRYSVIVKVIPYDGTEHGIKFKRKNEETKNKIDKKRNHDYETFEGWKLFCTIDEIVVISINNGSIEISRTSGIPFYLVFNCLKHMYSFISLLDGYYRLSCKWIFNVCLNVPTPSLQILYAMKCHGPVGGEFSYAKLEEKSSNKPGTFIIRESESNYNTYYIDVCMKDSLKPKTFKLEKWSTGEFMFNNDIYPNMQRLIAAYRDPEGEIYLNSCLSPSEFDISPLLLCRKNILVGESLTDSSDLSSSVPRSPQCIDSKTLQVFRNNYKYGSRGLTMVYRCMWLYTKNKKIEVAMKILKQEAVDKHLKDYLTLAGQWAFLDNNAIVRFFGMTLNKNTSFVTEYFELGPLDEYLRKNRANILEIDLIEASKNLANALWYLQEKYIVHGKIRCRKLMVNCHNDKCFSIKLTDPGIHTSYHLNEVHWIPPEFYKMYNNARKSPKADIWAVGTTLWEIFNYGQDFQDPNEPPESYMRWYLAGNRLPKPNRRDFHSPMYALMKMCWESDPDKRIQHQDIVKTIHHMLYASFSNERSNAYETPDEPEKSNVRSSNQSIASNQTTSTIAMGDLMPSERIQIDITHGEQNGFLNDQILDSSGFSCSTNQTTMTDVDHLNLSDDEDEFQSVYDVDDFRVILQGEIGRGNYGVVYIASMEKTCASNSNNPSQLVAVKKLRNCLSAEFSRKREKDFKRERDIMKSLKHDNIVKILGVCKNQEKMTFVMEYIEHKSLLSYLNFKKESIGTKQRLKYAMDIAEGMHYLGTKNIVHRDLAARNILVVDENHVKISDFGLAQFLNVGNYYIVKSERELPIKWYAPESLKYGKFSFKSDVWSYGVTLLEMFNNGDPPMMTEKEPIKEAQVLLEILESGTRFPPPEFCSRITYSRLIMPCWEIEHEVRPTFLTIIKTIKDLMLHT